MIVIFGTGKKMQTALSSVLRVTGLFLNGKK